MSEIPDFDHTELLELVKARMPFGKHKGLLMIDLPEDYLVWFASQGFPQGKVGMRLRAVYEFKLNGLDALFDPLR